jgi:hypothetical protein
VRCHMVLYTPYFLQRYTSLRITLAVVELVGFEPTCLLDANELLSQLSYNPKNN